MISITGGIPLTAAYWHNYAGGCVTSIRSSLEDYGGFLRESESARPQLIVTHCRWRKASWFAWSESLRILQIAELSHCHACSMQKQCPCAAAAKTAAGSRI